MLYVFSLQLRLRFSSCFISEERFPLEGSTDWKQKSTFQPRLHPAHLIGNLNVYVLFYFPHNPVRSQWEELFF